MVVKLIRLNHKIAIRLYLVEESCTYLQLSLQAVSPETFGYTLVVTTTTAEDVKICAKPEFHFDALLELGIKGRPCLYVHIPSRVTWEVYSENSWENFILCEPSVQCVPGYYHGNKAAGA
jgi:hypothetical protein